MKWNRSIPMLSVAALLTGCAATSLPLRTEIDGRPQEPGERPKSGLDFLTHNGTNTLAFIEFDEQGDFKSRDFALRVVSDVKAAAGRKKLLLVTYIHGWQNNSHPASGDVEKFTGLVNQLSAMDFIQKDFHVYGVYFGWRGRLVAATKNRFIDTVFFSGFKAFTFWTREAAAERVGKLSSTEALMWLVKAARDNPDSRTLLIGHSFGALVLENAVAQTLIARGLDPAMQEKDISPPADLIVLVNQAAPGLTAKRLIEFFKTAIDAKSCASMSPSKPLIVSITSSADAATSTLFPVGRTVGSLFNIVGRDYTDIEGQKDRPVSQNKFTRRTAGHNPILWSHIITNAGPAVVPGSLSAAEYDLKHPPRAADAPWTFLGPKDRWVLVPSGEPFNRTPYWIVAAPKSFIRDHGDVWNSNVVAFVATLMGRRNILGEAQSTFQTRATPTPATQ